MLGIMSLTEGLALASEAKLDLIEVSPMASPPVCKISSLAAIREGLRRKHKESKQKQKSNIVKESPPMSYNIADNDLNIRIRNIRTWLEQGHKVKVSVQFSGREMFHIDIGSSKLQRIFKEVADLAKVDTEPKMQGRSLSCIISPLKH